MVAMAVGAYMIALFDQLLLLPPEVVFSPGLLSFTVPEVVIQN